MEWKISWIHHITWFKWINCIVICLCLNLLCSVSNFRAELQSQSKITQSSKIIQKSGHKPKSFYETKRNNNSSCNPLHVCRKDTFEICVPDEIDSHALTSRRLWDFGSLNCYFWNFGGFSSQEFNKELGLRGFGELNNMEGWDSSHLIAY